MAIKPLLAATEYDIPAGAMTIEHGDLVGRAFGQLQSRYQGMWTGIRAAVRVRDGQYRVADIVVVKGSMPESRVIAVPPLAVLQFLSMDDRAGELQETIDEYIDFGVGCVWVIDPSRERAYVYTAAGMREAKDGVLRSPGGEIQLSLSALFPESRKWDLAACS